MHITLILLLPVLPLAFWIWMFWDFAEHGDVPQNLRLLWTILFVFGNIFTAVYYFFTMYRKKQ